MSTLFTLNSSWHESAWLFEQLAFANSGDSILLTQDAVLALHSPISLASFLAKSASRDITVFALAEDCRLRGIENKYDSVAVVEYSGFVDLVVKHDKQVSW